MATELSHNRLMANALGCLVLLLLCLPTCLSLAGSLGSLPAPRPDDPDGGKAIGIYLFGIALTGLISLSAAVSLWRSVVLLRRGPVSPPTE
jgi:hypothetical protein